MSRPSRRNMPGGASLRAIRSRRSRYPSATPAARPDIPTGTAVRAFKFAWVSGQCVRAAAPHPPAERPLPAGGPSAVPDDEPVASAVTALARSRLVRPCAGLPAGGAFRPGARVPSLRPPEASCVGAGPGVGDQGGQGPGGHLCVKLFAGTGARGAANAPRRPPSGKGTSKPEGTHCSERSGG